MKPFGICQLQRTHIVVPYIGTWIETPLTDCQNCFGTVVPYIGTWIETKGNWKYKWHQSVVPYIGTWIETDRDERGHETVDGRTLYRYVD